MAIAVILKDMLLYFSTMPMDQDFPEDSRVIGYINMQRRAFPMNNNN